MYSGNSIKQPTNHTSYQIMSLWYFILEFNLKSLFDFQYEAQELVTAYEHVVLMLIYAHHTFNSEDSLRSIPGFSPGWGSLADGGSRGLKDWWYDSEINREPAGSSGALTLQFSPDGSPSAHRKEKKKNMIAWSSFICLCPSVKINSVTVSNKY